MEQTNDQSEKRKTWLVVFVVTLFTLAVFWSVDSSVLYVLLGVAAFSLYKILSHSKRKQEDDDYEPSYREAYRQQKPSFWDEVKKSFDNNPNAGYVNKQQRTQKLVSFIIAGSVGFIFFIIVLSAVFSDNSPTSAELREQGQSFFNQEKYDSSIYYYNLAIQNNSEDPDLYYERGNAFLYANNNDSAMIDYDRALALNPSYKEAHYNKGWIYFNRKQYRNSINQAKRAMEIDPTYTDGMLLIGDGFYNSSQLDSAMVWYEDAYARGAKSAALCHIMAYVYDTKGNTQKAIPFYKEALSLDPNRTEIYTRLGEIVGGEEGNQYRQKAAQYQK